MKKDSTCIGCFHKVNFFCAYILTFYEISSSTGYWEEGGKKKRKPMFVGYKKVTLESQVGKRNHCIKAPLPPLKIFNKIP